MEKLWYSLLALGFCLVFCYACATGVKVGCDGPPLEEVGLVIGKPCLLEAETPTPEAEKVIVYRTVTETVYQPVIGLETVRYLGGLVAISSLLAIGTVLAIRALWKANWW